MVALYATFLNRAFDQVLMDVALHRLPVTFVLDRAGVTGEDGPSHNGMWDLALLGIVPGMRIAAPRDAATLRAELREAVDVSDGPTVRALPEDRRSARDVPALRRVGGVDVLAEPDADAAVDVLLVSVGAMAGDVPRGGRSGWPSRPATRVRVVDPRWVTAGRPGAARAGRRRAAGRHRRGRRGRRRRRLPARPALRDAGLDVPTREIGIPVAVPGARHGGRACRRPHRADRAGHPGGSSSWPAVLGRGEPSAPSVLSSRRCTTSTGGSERYATAGRREIGGDLDQTTGSRRRMTACESLWWRTKSNWRRRWPVACAARAWPSTSPTTATRAIARRR